MDPENHPGVRVPDMVTFPSSTTQLTWDSTIYPSTGGDGSLLIFTPIIGTPDGTLTPIITAANTLVGGNYAGFANISFAASATMRTLFDSYRPVSAVIYAEFIGPSTNDGGQVCMGLIPRTGQNTNAQLEALVPNFTAGGAQSFTKILPLRNGAVITWKPQDNKDLEYKDIQDNNALDHELPHLFICTAGQTAGTGGALRVRVVCNFELIPTSDANTFIDAKTSPSNLGRLQDAMNWGAEMYNNMSAFVSTVSPYVQPVLSQATVAATNLGLAYMSNTRAASRGNSLRLGY